MPHVGDARRIGKSRPHIFHHTFRHSFPHSVDPVTQLHFSGKINWVFPETAPLQAFPIGFVVFSSSDVVLYVGCSKAQILATVGCHTWSLATVYTHTIGIIWSTSIFCCGDQRRLFRRNDEMKTEYFSLATASFPSKYFRHFTD